LSLISWGELVYTIEREQGTEVANEVIRDLDRGPILLAEVNRARVDSAARLKSKHRISYADAFAIALAQEVGATLVSGDPEFESIEKLVPVLWLER